MLPFVMWKLAIISCTVEFRAGNERKGTKIIAWFNWKWLIKWFKRSKYLVAAMLTSGLAQRLQALVSLLRSKKVKDRLFVVFWKYQGKALKFLSLLLFTSCTCNVERIYRRVVPKAKKKWATATFQQGYNSVKKCEGEIISMSRAWDKEKIWDPDRIRTYDIPNTGRADPSSMQDECQIWTWYMASLSMSSP